MKVRVDGLAWVAREELGDEVVVKLKRKLTIVPRKTAAYDDTKPAPLHCYGLTKTHFGFPRDYFFDTAGRAHDITWDLSEGHDAFDCESLIRQEGDYAEQGEAVDALIEWFGHFGDHQLSNMEQGKHLGGILQADPAFGKTVTALAFAHRLHRTVLVIVHKEFLLTQWVKYVKRFLPDAKIGFVRESKCEFEGCDIVIAMAQSLALDGQDGKRRYPNELYRWPGILVPDEVHRIGAPTWSPVPARFPAAIRLGLTATPRRRDGCDKVFWWHLGGIRYRAKTERPKLPVRMVESGVRGPEFIQREGISPSTVINIVAKLTRRNHKIIEELVGALASPQKRKIMVLSERLEHLRDLDAMLAQACEHAGIEGVTTGFYVGEWFTGKRTRKLAQRTWPLEGDGRELAIQALYRSFARRKYLGKPRGIKNVDGERHVFLRREDDGGLAQDIIEGIYVKGGSDGRKPDPRDDDWVNLEKLPDDRAMYAIARAYDIAQKVVEKKKTCTSEDLEQAERARVLWCTYQMVSEGVSIDPIDVLLFATPISDVEQSYGRGRRTCVPVEHGGGSTPEMCNHYCAWRAEGCKGKPTPIACDIVDRDIPLSRRRQGYRLEFYEGLKVKVSGSGAP